MLSIVVLVSGGGTNLQAIIDRIEAGTIRNTRIVGVISNKPDAYALERAAKNAIPSCCISPRSFEKRSEFDSALLNEINRMKPDLVVLAGYLVILPEQLVQAYEGRIINIHPSLIPSFCGDGYYGLKVHEAVLKRGCKVTGATVHFVDTGTDTGPIILQKPVIVEPEDTPKTLQLRVMQQAEWEILPAAIDAIANGRLVIKDGKVRINS
jgi:phosphoribosylglycinamide formyltransferase 1